MTSADVAAVETLGTQARTLLEAIKADGAVGRLRVARYPGAEFLTDQLSDAEESLTSACTAIELMLRAKGDSIVYDYEFYVLHLGLGLDDAVAEILEDNRINIPRTMALRQYAATAAPGQFP